MILSFVILLIAPDIMHIGPPSPEPGLQDIFAPYWPIEIGSNSELMALADTEGWPGNGTEEHPYVIGDLVIESDGWTVNGIEISGTDLFLTIENCTLTGFSSYGILVDNCSNIRLFNNRINKTTWGIRIDHCPSTEICFNLIDRSSIGIISNNGNSNSINNNTIYLPEFEGIHIEDETNCMVERNNIVLGSGGGSGAVIRGCTYMEFDQNKIISGSDIPSPLKVSNCALMRIGHDRFQNGSEISLVDSIGSIFLENEMHDVPLRLDRSTFEFHNNSFFGCGVIVDEYSTGPWLQNVEIDTSNTVNGRMIWYARSNSSLNALTPDQKIGQLIIFNVKEGRVPSITLGNTTVAIQAVSCDGLTLDGPTISDCDHGIIVQNTINSAILRSNISRSKRNGIRMFNSLNNEIRGNLILDTQRYDQEEGGIFLHNCQDCIVEENTVFSQLGSDSPLGIHLSWSDNNMITNNYMFYNGGTVDSYRSWEFQSFDRIGNNWWNSSNGIGNYWRDWRTPDDDGDGIVDIPYPIGATGAVMPQDNYPLTTCPVVAPPENISVISADSGLLISWDPPVQTWFASIGSYVLYKGFDTGILTLFASVNADTPYYHDTSAIPGTYYYYQVTAINQLMESDPSEIVRAELTTIPTTINITSPVNGSFFNRNEAVVEWEVFENGSGIDHFEVRLDEGPWIDTGINTSYLLSGLPEGLHTVHAAVVDNWSGIRVDSANFTVDMTGPDLTIIRPDNGSFINTRQVTVEWASSDELSEITVFEVRADFYNWTTTENENWYEFNFSTEGLHHVEVAAVDEAGNRVEKGISFTLDTHLPELTIETPEDGLYFTIGDIKISWVGSDNGTGLEGYWFRMNDWNWTSIGMRTDRSLWGLPDGHYKICIKAVDRAGNSRTETVGFVIDGTSPDLRVLSPVDGSFISNSPVTVRWNGTDGTSGIDHFEIRLEGDTWREVGDDLTFTMVNLIEGHYLFSVRAWDRAGNDITVSTSFTLDQTRPEVVTYSPVGDEVDVGTVISITFNERMHTSTMQFHMDDVKGNIEWKGDRAIFLPDEDLDFGNEYTVTAVGWDLAGNRMEKLIWKFTTTNKGTVQGYIFDRKGHPVEFVRIYVEGENDTRSREDGFFIIDLPAGINTIIFEADGYRRVEVEMEIKPGRLHTIDSLVLSDDDRGGLTTMSCLLWAFLVMISMASMTALALYLNSRRKAQSTIPEE
ncbi:MAG: right-handed parallel beta-helix repeat-containing protein [Candidatus Thermoplasmatota archaeon]|nr:right-handed parallel beta-helix repeat-containing protein [Candidatus Thermoplasmatota archaeon]